MGLYPVQDAQRVSEQVTVHLFQMAYSNTVTIPYYTNDLLH